MFEYVVTTILLLFLLSYLRFLWTIRRGLEHLAQPRSDTTPFSTVIIAARNEEKNINQALRALCDQEYDSGKFEVIVVDDHSDDHTLQVASQFADSVAHPRITVVSLGDQSGKPAAIAYGVSIASGEFILCTDADCVIPKTWIKSMVGCFDPAVAFVAGPVVERPSHTLLSTLQSVEYLSLTITAAGLIGSGRPIICSGASVAYRKSAFAHVSGFGVSTTSCDDETLMQRMALRNAGKVVFNGDTTAIVTTATPPIVSAFWHQRTRWAAKRGRYEDSSILRRLLLLYGFFFVLFAASLFAIVNPILCLPVVGAVLLKVVAEFLVLSRGARLLKQTLPMGQFLIAELFHVPYIAVAGLIGQFGTFRWKDRNLER